MKKTTVVIVALALAALGASGVYARGSMGGGGFFGPNADLDSVRKFQKETLPLRDEMMVKQLELRQELDKSSSDEARIAELEKEIDGLRATVRAAAEKRGFSGGAGSCYPGMKGARQGGRGPGPMMGGCGCRGWGM